MAVRYKDYYAVLGVDRKATAEEIQKAFRGAARRHHPDVSKAPGAEERYKEINEAYEVLKDPEKRARYDALGENWQEGQDFAPPPPRRGGKGFGSYGGQEMPFGDFSDFFHVIFGGGFGVPGDFGAFSGARARPGGPRRGEDVEFSLEISLEEAQRGCRRSLVWEDDGGKRQTLEVRIPSGVTEGSRVRVAGKGHPGSGGGAPGDLYLRISLLPHGRFAVDGHDLRTSVEVAPWEAALGGEIPVETISGPVEMRIPPGTQGSQVFRLRGKGLPKRRKDDRGDLYVTVRIAIPRQLSSRERELFEELARVSTWKPRGE